MTAARFGYPAARRRSIGRVLAAAIALIAAAPAWPVRAEGETKRVEIKNVAFAPAVVMVHAGDIVVWENQDVVAHTATSEQGGFDVEVPPGGKASAVMTRPGTFPYICRYHPNMQGRIIAEP